MTKFEEARKKSNELTFPYNMFFDDFISECEETEKKYDELVKDVKRYFELFYQSKSRDSKEQIEQSMLFDKLSKVGVSND